MPGWVIRHRDAMPAVPCPCGEAVRTLTGADNDDLSVHFVTIKQDSEAHYHTRLTEVYVVVAGSGEIELDSQRHPLREGTVVLIPPGTRHRAVPGPAGLTIVNVVRPPFDPKDEHHDR